MAVVQHVGGSGFGKELVEIGLLQVGDAVAFFKADSVVEPCCHIIVDSVEYIVNSVSDKKIKGGTAFLQALSSRSL